MADLLWKGDLKKKGKRKKKKKKNCTCLAYLKTVMTSFEKKEKEKMQLNLRRFSFDWSRVTEIGLETLMFKHRIESKYQSYWVYNFSASSNNFSVTKKRRRKTIRYLTRRRRVRTFLSLRFSSEISRERVNKIFNRCSVGTESYAAQHVANSSGINAKEKERERDSR